MSPPPSLDAKDKIDAFAKKLTQLLLAAPPAFQLAIAISAAIGPFLTLGPFLERAFEIWTKFSDWTKVFVGNLFDVDIAQVLWPSIFVGILLTPLLLTSLWKFASSPSTSFRLKDRLKSVVLSFFLLTMVLKVHAFSIVPETYFTFLDPAADIPRSVRLISLANFFVPLFLLLALLLIQFSVIERVVKVCIWLLVAVYTLDTIFTVFGLIKAREAEAQRQSAYELFKEGTLAEEGFLSYVQLSLNIEFTRYASAIGKLSFLAMVVSCIIIPERIRSMCVLVIVFVAIFIGYSGLQYFLGKESV